MSTIKDDLARYSLELSLRKKMSNTPLQPGNELLRVGSKVTLRETSQMTHPSHSIVVAKVTNQMVYKPNNGNANGVYASHLKDVYFTKHYPGLETEVPDIPESHELPSFVIAEGMREVVPGITSEEFWTEFALQVGKRIETEAYLRRKRRK